jgi:hypothetical protein
MKIYLKLYLVKYLEYCYVAVETATSEDITEMGDFPYELTSAKKNARNVALLELFSIILCGDISLLRQYPIHIL